MSEAQEHVVTRTHEPGHPDSEYATCEDPGDCNPPVKADVSEATRKELVDPVMVPVRIK
jgi:hypothetical protein